MKSHDFCAFVEQLPQTTHFIGSTYSFNLIYRNKLKIHVRIFRFRCIRHVSMLKIEDCVQKSMIVLLCIGVLLQLHCMYRYWLEHSSLLYANIYFLMSSLVLRAYELCGLPLVMGITYLFQFLHGIIDHLVQASLKVFCACKRRSEKNVPAENIDCNG